MLFILITFTKENNMFYFIIRIDYNRQCTVDVSIESHGRLDLSFIISENVLSMQFKSISGIFIFFCLSSFLQIKKTYVQFFFFNKILVCGSK